MLSLSVQGQEMRIIIISTVLTTRVRAFEIKVEKDAYSFQKSSLIVSKHTQTYTHSCYCDL